MISKRPTAARALLIAVAMTLSAVVSQPTSAQDASPTATTACAGGYSPYFRIGGQVGTSLGFTYAQLEARGATKLNVSYYCGQHGLVSESYVGVPLYDLLQEAGFVVDPDQKNDILRQSIVVTATDCYQATLAMAEILPTFAGQQVLVAYADGDGAPLGADEGMAKLIVPGDKAGGRYVSNITRILVRQPSSPPQAR